MGGGEGGKRDDADRHEGTEARRDEVVNGGERGKMKERQSDEATERRRGRKLRNSMTGLLWFRGR
jgi:hypothetical protein